MSDYFFDKDCPSYAQGNGTPEFWKKQYDFVDKQNRLFRDQIKQLEAQLKEANEVINFYADPSNYDMDSSFINDDDELVSYLDEITYEFGDYKKYPMQDYVGGKLAREYKQKWSK